MKITPTKPTGLTKKHIHLLTEEKLQVLAYAYGLRISRFERRAYKIFFYLELDDVKVGVEYERNANIINMGQGTRGSSSYASFGGHYSFAHMVEIFKSFFSKGPVEFPATAVNRKKCAVAGSQKLKAILAETTTAL